MSGAKHTAPFDTFCVRIRYYLCTIRSAPIVFWHFRTGDERVYFWLHTSPFSEVNVQ